MAADLRPEQRDALELAALKAIDPDGEEFIDFDGDVHDAVRKILAAVLPVHRKQVAAEIEERLQQMREEGEPDMRQAIWHVRSIARGGE